MDIIKQPKIKENKRKKKCYNCSSLLQYSNLDIQIDRDGHYIVCPFFKAFITVDVIV